MRTPVNLTYANDTVQRLRREPGTTNSNEIKNRRHEPICPPSLAVLTDLQNPQNLRKSILALTLTLPRRAAILFVSVFSAELRLVLYV